MSLVYDQEEQRYAPQMGNIVDAGANYAGSVARSQLQAMCPGTDISKVTDAEIMTIASDIVKNITPVDLIQLADNKSNVFKEFANKLGTKVCEFAKTKSSKGSGFPTWGYGAIAVGVLLVGWMLFKK